jgi:hypothetical protein
MGQGVVSDWTRSTLVRGVLGLTLGLLLAMSIGADWARAGVPSANFGFELATASVGGKLGPTDLSVGSASGVGVARYGVLDSSNQDSLVTLLANAGLQLYPVLGVPCPSGSSCANNWSPSPSVAASEMSQIVAAFAQRYGVHGSFWKANPGLPYLPVQNFEIGNEENEPTQWVVDSAHLHWNNATYSAVGPAYYAQVYNAARTALHQVDPSGVAVVGGLADSARLGVDVQLDEKYLAALTPGAVDAVGYHDWVYDVSDSLLKSDTADLRVWMNENGFAGVPLHVNEFGACQAIPQGTGGSCPSNVSQTSAAWGSVAADYVQWAMCTPWLDVNNIQPFYWGATPATDQSIWLPLVSGNGTLTAYGTDYLSVVQTLTSGGCPSSTSSSSGSAPANTSPPTVQGPAVSGNVLAASPGAWTGNPTTTSYQWERCNAAGSNCSSIGGENAMTFAVQPEDIGSTLVFSVTEINSAGAAAASSAPTGVVTSGTVAPAPVPVTPSRPVTTPARLGSMDLRVMHVTRRGRYLTIKVRHHSGSGSVIVTAATKHGRKEIRRRLKSHANNSTTITFTAELLLGRWTVTIDGKPARGYARPRQVRRDVTLTKLTKRRRS